jgi:hypothetical protein
MRKSFRRAAFSWLRTLFKQSARKDHDPGVDGAALPAPIETTTIEPKGSGNGPRIRSQTACHQERHMRCSWRATRPWQLE